jgi:hypothetical protein
MDYDLLYESTAKNITIPHRTDIAAKLMMPFEIGTVVLSHGKSVISDAYQSYILVELSSKKLMYSVLLLNAVVVKRAIRITPTGLKISARIFFKKLSSLKFR